MIAHRSGGRTRQGLLVMLLRLPQSIAGRPSTGLRDSLITQAWEYELPEEFRTPAWLQRFVAACGSTGYGPAEKQVIMTLLLDCLNDGIEAGDESIERLWNDVAPLLSTDRSIHSSLIEHWSVPGEPLEDAFAITPRLRGLAGQPVSS